MKNFKIKVIPAKFTNLTSKTDIERIAGSSKDATNQQQDLELTDLEHIPEMFDLTDENIYTEALASEPDVNKSSPPITLQENTDKQLFFFGRDKLKIVCKMLLVILSFVVFI